MRLGDVLRTAGVATLEAWVARCVVNAAHDVKRNAYPTGARLGELALTPDGTPPDSEAPHTDAAIVREAVRKLPCASVTRSTCASISASSTPQLPRHLAFEVGTVSATLHAARASLAQTLQEVLR